MLSLIKKVYVVVCVCGGVWCFTLVPLRIDGVSMLPTCRQDERIIVERLSSFIPSVMLYRGAIIAYHDPRAHNNPIGVKRIIGLPGETVRIVHDEISVTSTHATHEVFPRGSVIGRSDNGEDQVRILGVDDYFVMGDNRAESRDSREWGTIQPHEMIGRVILGCSFE